ncbi:Hsp20/alpha crystallin family protein [Legionella tunisiensis]|uniref:Hsp20/alpha crystallin family protein n=1 Tax=Legionella tunisiensis TaxID=1034944 RepID=UPI0002EBF452|nr:Hsp20/alpha crystallin family protein [Legionella tunisiensis]
MNLIKRNYQPFPKDLNRMLEHFFREPADNSFIDTGTWAPAVDIKEEKDKFIVVADIPGVNKGDIKVSLTNNVLTIQGQRQFEKSENKDNYSRMERVQGQFYRRFSLPQSVDESKIEASYKNGVLNVSIPKKESTVEKQIEVKISE